MTVSQEYIDGLIVDLRERLSVEVKQWIDPCSEAGKAKIVKGCIALKNQDGGFFVVGFENGTWEPDRANAPTDVRAVWDGDQIQGLIGKHASEAFEIHLRFAKLDGQEYPVLEVEPGVMSPVAAKKEIADPDASRKLVKLHAVYARSLSANNTASTTEMHYRDWPDLAKRCSDNREAEIGAFLRRNLDRVQIGALARAASGVYGSMPAPEPPPAIRAELFRRDGYERFQQQKQRRNLLYMPRHGSWEAAFVLEGPVEPRNPDESFLNLINASNPRYSGFPVWIDSRGFVKEDGTPDTSSAPYTYGEGWEAFIYDDKPESVRRRIEFWRAEPAGRFYLYRALQDDLATGPKAPKSVTELDFVIPVLRTAEAIAVSMAFAKAMGAKGEQATVHHAFRWDGLQGRRLSSWARSEANSGLYGDVGPGYVSHQQYAESLVSVPLDAPASVLGRYVRDATAPLYWAFSGFVPPSGFVEEVTDRLLSRRF